MAQVNITHITAVDDTQAIKLAQESHRIVAFEAHGMSGDIEARAVSVFTLNVHKEASISGVDSEVQILISGNDWPKHLDETPYDRQEAKQHFDIMAERIFKSLGSVTDRRLYVWVTPYVTSGWAE